MSVLDAALKLLGLSEALHKWQRMLKELKAERRLRVAGYADRIAASIGRAAAAAEKLSDKNLEVRSRRRLMRDIAREIGRLKGYVEDVAETLKNDLDGRKIAGIKRRLETLRLAATEVAPDRSDMPQLLKRLAEAEGYMLALADRLRT